jgi:hypothetical protein
MRSACVNGRLPGAHPAPMPTASVEREKRFRRINGCARWMGGVIH